MNALSISGVGGQVNARGVRDITYMANSDTYYHDTILMIWWTKLFTAIVKSINYL